MRRKLGIFVQFVLIIFVYYHRPPIPISASIPPHTFLSPFFLLLITLWVQLGKIGFFSPIDKACLFMDSVIQLLKWHLPLICPEWKNSKVNSLTLSWALLVICLKLVSTGVWGFCRVKLTHHTPSLSWEDSVDKRAWLPEFDPWDLHGEKRETILAHSFLTSTVHSSNCTHTCTCIHTHIIIIIITELM